MEYQQIDSEDERSLVDRIWLKGIYSVSDLMKSYILLNLLIKQNIL